MNQRYPGLAMALLLLPVIQPHARPLAAQGNVLDQDDVILVDSVGSNLITFHRNTGSVDDLRPLIIRGIKAAVDSIGRVIEVSDVEFRVMVFPERTIPSKGMSGAAPNARHIYLLLDPDHPRLRRGLSEELVHTIAHEYHHTLRNRSVGYGETLFEALVSEGLADHFAVEVTGDPPPWSDPPSPEEIAFWKNKAQEIWFGTEYDHLAWFVGMNSDIPRGTGYAIGFQIVGDYLATHPREKPSTLVSVPATAFLEREEAQGPTTGSFLVARIDEVWGSRSARGTGLIGRL